MIFQKKLIKTIANALKTWYNIIDGGEGDPRPNIHSQKEGKKNGGKHILPYTPSPLRYPGGKTKLYNYIRSLIDINGLLGETYIEPFAGGAGLALKLLQNNDVKRIVINDLDPAIYAFWHSVLHNAQQMCDFINTAPLTVDEWDKQRNVFTNHAEHSQIELAKAVLYLNRTNISGIINGGIIGRRDQTGKYKMDARFNRASLVSKINTISSLSNRIDIYNLDASIFLQTELKHYHKVFINFDPPYVTKGSQLYKKSFSANDHEALRDKIIACQRKWVVTYDVCDFISKLYAGYKASYVDINYSASRVRKAKEYIFFSNNLIIPAKTTLIGEEK